MSARVLASIALSAAAALLFVGCLPGDTRPPPGGLHFQVEPSAAVTEGVTTADGWHITFEKLLVGLGGAAVNDLGPGYGTGCESYTYGWYDRLFDLTVPGKQKLADVYALGSCKLNFHITSPDSDAVLGQGVTAQDLAFMRLEGEDPIFQRGRRSVYLRGKATREAVTKRFEWSFRAGFYLFGCGYDEDDPGKPYASKVELRGGTALSRSLKVHGEELFRERPNDESALCFDAFADADTDGDQVVTLEELSLLPGPALEVDAGVGVGDGGAPSLALVLYYYFLPRMVRMNDSGPCETYGPSVLDRGQE